MYVNQVTIHPHIVTDSTSPQQISKSDSPTTINIENVINITRDGCSTSKNTEQTSPPKSPTPSARSTSISIASIESDLASSVIDSDVDEFEDAKTGCMLKKLGQQTAHPVDSNPLSNISPEIGVLLGQQIERDVSSSNGPQVASLSLTNSTDVTFGHKKYHRGPVTIQQILVEKPAHNGHNNPAFENTNDCSSTTARTKAPEHDTHSDSLPPWQTYKNILNHKTAIITAIIVITTLLLGIVVFTSLHFLQDGVLQSVAGIDDKKSQRLISRDEWVAQPPSVPLEDLETPVSRVIITHTTTQNCTTRPMCVFRVRFLQTFDVESRSYDDIRYNFLVGGDGNAYVGRGWDKVGAHTKGYNENSIGIAFVGTFNKWAPPEEQLNVTQWLLSEGVRLNKLDPDYKLYGTRQLDPSDGPGDALYEIITKWPNWSSELL